MNSKKRWYDNDPTVSLAISLIRNTTFENQIKLSSFIKQRISEYGLVPNVAPKNIFGIFKRRWYDINEELFDAIESLRVTPVDLQKRIALEIISFLCEIDDSVKSDMV